MPASASDAAAHKKHIATLSKEILKYHKGVRKLPVLNVYRLKMRAIPFMAHLFFDFHRIFGAGMDLEVDTEANEKEYTDEERALFDKAAALLPGFKDTIIALYDPEDPDIYGLFLRILMKSTNGACSDDSKVFKSMILEIMLIKKATLSIPRYPSLTQKHCEVSTIPILLNFFCPSNGKMREFKKRINNPAHEHPGYRLAMTGSTTAYGSSGTATKEPKAIKHKMTKATPESIAYAVSHVRSNLSKKLNWAVNDGPFSYEQFFNNIIRLLSTDTPFAKKILKRYTDITPAFQKSRKGNTEWEAPTIDPVQAILEELEAAENDDASNAEDNNGNGGGNHDGDDGNGSDSGSGKVIDRFLKDHGLLGIDDEELSELSDDDEVDAAQKAKRAGSAKKRARSVVLSLDEEEEVGVSNSKTARHSKAKKKPKTPAVDDDDENAPPKPQARRAATLQRRIRH
ncbi:hypothetical protein EST38_g11121 [Candolleomyces aberdarensis]|uniref:Uncharacterized protein n=1 Tax=Candolleomyces aberdarensis TaxID=2316362 RepID=A0A4Q2D780_9AGAR|nr:hypothetical protein EST38_g11121 [Candolleomyces aberdarensis]